MLKLRSVVWRQVYGLVSSVAIKKSRLLEVSNAFFSHPVIGIPTQGKRRATQAKTQKHAALWLPSFRLIR